MRTFAVTCVGVLSYPFALCVGIGIAATHRPGVRTPFDRNDEDGHPTSPTKRWADQPFGMREAA